MDASAVESYCFLTVGGLFVSDTGFNPYLEG